MYAFLLLLHVLLFVFWVGVDVGVFLLTRVAQKGSHYTVEQRMLCLKVATWLDQGPRVCFVLMIAVGSLLGYMGGWLPLSGIQTLIICLLDLVWLAIAIGCFLFYGKPLGQRLFKIDTVIQMCLLVFIGGIGLYQLCKAEPDIQSWVAIKLCLYASICLFSLILTMISAPMFQGFEKLATDGPSPAVQRELDIATPPVLFVVLLIYLAATLAAYFGLAKIPA